MVGVGGGSNRAKIPRKDGLVQLRSSATSKYQQLKINIGQNEINA